MSIILLFIHVACICLKTNVANVSQSTLTYSHCFERKNVSLSLVHALVESIAKKPLASLLIVAFGPLYIVSKPLYN